jgi:hypothetical protein
MQIAPANPALRKPVYGMDIRNLAFSPDGESVLAEVGIVGSAEPDGNETWVGLLKPTVEKQDPVLLARGAPLFWSKDGAAFYFRDVERTGAVYRWDTDLKDAFIVPGFEHIHVLGRIPGTNVVFTVRRVDAKNSELALAALDGSEVKASVAARVAQIPVRDAEGRYLEAVDATQTEWRLTYFGGIEQSGFPHLRTVRVNAKE